MQIASTTIASGKHRVIGEALQSVVGWVDKCILLDVGLDDRTAEVAREICGDKLVIVQEPPTGTIAQWRNRALEVASEQGADWAITLDTDERIETNGEDIRRALETTKAETVFMREKEGQRSFRYWKDRAFRLPAKHRWCGAAHEEYESWKGTQAHFGSSRFWEVPKPLRRLLNREAYVVRTLTRSTAEEPGNPRWWFYLGDAQARLGEHEKAVEAFLKCVGLNGWTEEKAVACYRCADSLRLLKRFEEALEWCARGMVVDAGFAELPYLAAVCCMQMGKPEQAIHWAQASIGIGDVARGMLRHVPGITSGPLEVLEAAYQQLVEVTSCP